MTCGDCKHCIPQCVCGCDCECQIKSTDEISFQVSQDDDICCYGEHDNEPCEHFESAG